MNAQLTLEGTLLSFAWQNPHSRLVVETAAVDGSKTVREIEVGPISILQPLGIGPNSLRAGERVVVLARPNRRGGSLPVLGIAVTTDDGTRLPLHLSGRDPTGTPRTTATAESIAGRWLGRAEDFFALRTAILQRWKLTPSARDALASGASLGVAREQCIPYGPPELHIEPVLTTITLGASSVELTTDMDGVPVRRVVRLNLADHASDLAPSQNGHSIGRWDGDALVVDTVGFTAHPEGFGFGLGSSERKHLVERFTLSGEGRQLVYETTIEDPDVLAEAVHIMARLDYRPDLKPNYSGCDLDAARRYLDDRAR